MNINNDYIDTTDLINSLPIIETKMPTVGNNDTTNYQLIRLYLDSITHYGGDPHTLNIFLDNCDNFIDTFADRTQEQNPINKFIFRSLLGKLTHRALQIVGSRTELTTWLEIKNLLVLTFGDQRNIECLAQDLIYLKPNKTETPYQFGMRLQDARSLLASKINSSELKIDEKLIHLKNYDDITLKTFIRGLNGQLQNNVRLRDPKTLESAMNLVIEEENFLYASQNRHTLNTQTQFKVPNKYTPTNSQNHSYHTNNPYSNKPKHNFNNHQNTQFTARNQFNTQPRWQPQQNLRHHQQPHFNTFRPQMNNTTPNSQRNFIPNPNNSQIYRNQYFQNTPGQINSRFNRPNPQFSRMSRNTYKPEPMDTSSGNTKMFNQIIETPEIENYPDLENSLENYDDTFENYLVNDQEQQNYYQYEDDLVEQTETQNFHLDSHENDPT